MKHEQRARNDLIGRNLAEDALLQARVDDAARQAAIAAHGQVICLRYDGECAVCGEMLDAGTYGLWWQTTRQLAHRRFECPARPEYRDAPLVTQVAPAGRDEAMKLAGLRDSQFRTHRTARRKGTRGKYSRR